MKISPTPPAFDVIRTLRAAGHKSYLCGGCIRDALMGVPPKDWDITTAATPDQVEALFEHTVPVGKSFGVMIVVIGDEHFEVATFRTDGAYVDGRRPESVTFASAEEDVQRRDFTINALLYDPVAETVIDYVGGQADIEQKILRTVGDPESRFLEDHLRLLRAVRFAARTGFTLEENTHTAIRELAGLVRTVSAERVGEELRRMVSEGYSHAALTLLESTGLLAHIIPEAIAMRGMPQPKQFHPEGDVMTHTLIMLQLWDETHARGCLLADDTPRVEGDDDSASESTSLSQTDGEILGFAVLLHDIAKPVTLTVTDRIRFNEHDQIGAEMAVNILERLKRPRVVCDGVHDLIKRHMHFANLPNMRVAKLRRFLQKESFPLHLTLHRYDCLSSHRILERFEWGLHAWREELATPPDPEPLLTGKDLIAMGIPPGPGMGELLRAIDDACLEGKITTREEAEAFVKTRTTASQTGIKTNSAVIPKP